MIDAETSIFEQMKLLYVSKEDATVMESVIEATFIRQLKEALIV